MATFRYDKSSEAQVFLIAGFGLILLAALLSKMPVLLKSILIVGGGWLIGIGGYYQINLFAETKDTQYYVVLTLISIYWISLILLTLFWFARQIGMY
ncbi:hypothetical protein GCM10028807_12370 [Spirosoma daeguense]